MVSIDTKERKKMLSSLRTKIMMIALLPLIVALGFMITIVLDKYQISSEMGEHNEIAQFIVNFGSVLHEIQKERGMSGVYLSSQGNKFVKELNEQHELTKVRVQQFLLIIKGFNISRFGKGAKSATYEASTEITNGLNIVTTTKQSINSLSSEIAKTTVAIQKLESDTASIETVLDVIEAARAGEQGRGFAVVADEVRTLAGRTQQATQEIQTMISNLQTGAIAAVSAMEQGTLVTEQSVEQANIACDSLNTITSAMSNVVEMNEQIAVATDQQKSTIADIENKVLSIFNVANETALGANKTNASSSELLESAVNLKQSLSMFKV